MWAVVAGILSGLVSGVLGGIIGNVLAHRLAVGRAKQERSETAGSHIAALAAEMRDNVQLADKPIIGHGKVGLLTRQWERARPYAEALPPDLLGPIRQAYVGVERYNSIVEEERAKVPLGAGYMDKQVAQQAAVAKSALEQALAVLDRPEHSSASSLE